MVFILTCNIQFFDRLLKEDDEDELELSDLDVDESKKDTKQAEISHEDLSDISDLESSNDVTSQEYSDLRQKLNKVKNTKINSFFISWNNLFTLQINKRRQNGSESNVDQKSDEEELDFEGDEDVKELAEAPTKKRRENVESNESGGSVKEDGEHKSDKEELESGEELEDGEVSRFFLLNVISNFFLNNS